MWATRRKTIVLLIIIGFFTIFGVLPYWYTHREVPTCSDNKMNQDELGIDCGGACALVCRGGATPLTTLWTKVFPVRDGVYDIMSYMENTNYTIGAPRVPYTVKLYDKSGVVIAEKSGETYADPNERFTIFEGNLRTGDKVAVRGSIDVDTSFHWYTMNRTEPPQLLIEEKSLVGFEKSPKLTAKLKNDSPQTYFDIGVTVVIYDSKNNPIGVSSTKVPKILGHSSENISFTWPLPFVFESEGEECEVPVDTMLVLDRSGSMASEGKNPPQPFTRVREASATFASLLSQNDQVGMVSYSTVASNPIDVTLMSDFERAQKHILETPMGTDGVQYTNTGDALYRAGLEFETQRARPEARKVIVLLTDGEALEPNRPLRDGDPDYAKKYASDIAFRLRNSGVSIYTIGLGINANSAFLQSISSSPEHYYASPSVSDLREVYRRIASTICKKAPPAIEILPRIHDAK